MIKAVVVGYGNIGRAAVEAVRAAEDFCLLGVVRRDTQNIPPELAGVPVVDSTDRLDQKPDVAILALPTRSVAESAEKFLACGINTVDSFDVHSEIPELRTRLGTAAKNGDAVSIISAGWDPGSDSVVRAIMEACAPKGVTFTNFGPGMSMGHTVAVKAIPGVKDALSITLPKSAGVHSRAVYVSLDPGADFDTVAALIKADPYFINDETVVRRADDISALTDRGHSVNIERKGVSGATHNQRLSFAMSIDNPALTAQLMVSAARAGARLTPGCYTMIEIPPVYLLEGDDESAVARLV